MARYNNKTMLVDTSKQVKKSNELSMAKLNHGLSLNQMQLLAYAILKTQKDSVTEFRKHEFEEMFEIGKYLTAQARVDTQKVSMTQMSFEDFENEHFEYINVFSKLRYKEGLFTFVWNPEILPHILDLKERYVLTDIGVTVNFKSSFSWSLYDYLKASYGYWYKVFSKEALMKLFGVEKSKSYISNSGLFKKNVLDRAIEEINRHTELNVTCEDIKKGRSIVGFKISWSTGKGIKKVMSQQIEYISAFVDTILGDTLMYAAIEDKHNRENAIEIVRQVHAIKLNDLGDKSSLTQEYAGKLIDQLNGYLIQLNENLRNDGKSELYLPTEKLPMFNWLEQ